MIYILAMMLILSASSNGASSVLEEQQETLDLQNLIQEAIMQNPELDALRHRIEELEHKVEPAGARPDPVVGFAAMNYPLSLNPVNIDRFPMTQTQISYAQKFLAPGTLRLQRELAQWDVKIGSIDLEEKKLLIASIVRRTFTQMSFFASSLEVIKKNKEVLNQFLEISQTKYKAGKGILQDVLRARVALSKIDLVIAELKQQIQTSKAMLNTILNRDPNEPLADPPLLEQTQTHNDFTAAMLVAQENRPVLQALAAKIDKSKTATELAESRLNPDYTFRFAYGYRYDDVDFWTAGVTFNLPLWRGSKQREEIAQTEAQRLVVQSRLVAEKNNIAFAIRKALDEVGRTEEQMDLYDKSVVPQAETSLESAISGYQVEKVDFLTMLENQKTLFDLELERIRILAQHELSIIDLDNAVGSIPGLPTGKGE